MALNTTRRSVTCVAKGDTVMVLPDLPARGTRVTTEPGWVRLNVRYADGSREHAWFETHEGVEVAPS